MDWTPTESERAFTHFIMNAITTIHRALFRMGAKAAPISRARFTALDAPLITGAADDNPSAIGTYSVVGAQLSGAHFCSVDRLHHPNGPSSLLSR